MAIEHEHFAFPAAIPGNAKSSGDGGPGFDSPEPSSGRMSTAVGAESDQADVDRYQKAKLAASGVKPGGGSGFSVGAPDKLVTGRTVLSRNSNVGAGGLDLGGAVNHAINERRARQGLGLAAGNVTA